MKKRIMSKNIFIVVGLLVVAVAAAFFYKTKFLNKENKSINTMLMLIETDSTSGIAQWEKELNSRGLTAVIQVSGSVLEKDPELFKRLSNEGYEIAGSSNEVFWDMPYEQQYEYMKEAKDLVESITGKQMRIFGSRYVAYDENTLKAADALGVEYVMGRGTQDVNAVVYQPEEYKAKIISVTNVDVGEPMGRGSLCDYSLWARGASPEEFGEILDESIAKNPENMILVSHAYLGGTRLAWWEQYERVLGSEKLSWHGLDDWLANQEVITLPNDEIPINREVSYTTPNPAKAMEDYEAVEGFEEEEKDENSTTPTEAESMICE